MNLISLTPERKEIIKQFPIPDRDEHIYTSINEAVEDSLRRSFKDINFRTLKKKSNNYPKLEKNDTITNFLIGKLDSFIKKFIAYFSSKEDDFDKWHNEACEDFLTVLIQYYPDAKYGKAQKIVNMMFKHLYCMNFGDNKKDDKSDWRVLDEAYFEHCHLTLDSFTLEWFRRDVAVKWYNISNPKQKIKTPQDGEPIPKWSDIDYRDKDDFNYNDQDTWFIETRGKSYYHYMFFQTMIRECVNDKKECYGKCTPFQIEFYIWPEIQVHLAMEALFSQGIGSDDMLDEMIRNKKIKDGDSFKTATKTFKNLSLKDKGELLKHKIDLILKHCNEKT